LALKDMYNEQSISTLADAVQREYPAFDRGRFVAGVFDEGWKTRELKERTRHISTILGESLPPDYRTALAILRRVMPTVRHLGFVTIVFPDFVEAHGLDDWEASIPALEEMTQQMSAEYAIRPFIAHYPERTMARMLRWAQHENPEVRRLASEGCRPRLPWGIRLSALQADPSPILPILEQLKHDESESVRKSVANNLNDISKDNPEVVLDVLRRWQQDSTEELDWITRHALRTLIKAGHPGALELLGYPIEPAIAVHNLTVEPEAIPIGGEITLSFDVESLGDEPQNLVIDYVVYSVKADGRLTPKVWKLTKRILQPGEVARIARVHSFAPVTTRTYYPGEHAIEPKINGVLFGRASFTLS
jgi:3-methyladenine DNA glycosylase AlkC